MCSIVNQNNIESGIRRWRQLDHWPADFHNSFYRELRELLVHGLDKDNWEIIVNHLSRWKANRPKSKNFIYQQGLHQLNNLNEFLQQVNSTIENSTWTEIELIFQSACSIKNVESPVFASKLSHFIFPKLFPVIDRKVIGIDFMHYGSYWNFIKTNWNESTYKELCKTILSNEIGVNIFEQYPWPTKITEICLIGFNTV